MNFPLRYRLSGEPSEMCIRAEIGTLRRSIAAFRAPITAGAEYADRSLRILGRMPDRDSVSSERARFHKEIRVLIRKEQCAQSPIASLTLADKRDSRVFDDVMDYHDRLG